MATTTAIRSNVPPAAETDTNPKRQRGNASAASLTRRVSVSTKPEQDNLWIAQRYRDDPGECRIGRIRRGHEHEGRPLLARAA